MQRTKNETDQIKGLQNPNIVTISDQSPEKKDTEGPVSQRLTGANTSMISRNAKSFATLKEQTKKEHLPIENFAMIRSQDNNSPPQT